MLQMSVMNFSSGCNHCSTVRMFVHGRDASSIRQLSPVAVSWLCHPICLQQLPVYWCQVVHPDGDADSRCNRIHHCRVYTQKRSRTTTASTLYRVMICLSCYSISLITSWNQSHFLHRNYVGENPSTQQNYPLASGILPKWSNQWKVHRNSAMKSSLCVAD